MSINTKVLEIAASLRNGTAVNLDADNMDWAHV